jgi:hypothetical protein
VTKPTEDSPPQGLNWNQEEPKSAEGDAEAPQQEEVPSEGAQGPVKGVFDTQLTDAPPPAGKKGVPPPIPEPPEAETSSTQDSVAVKLGEMISDSLKNEELQAPIAAFDPGGEAASSAEQPSPEAAEGSVRGVFGGGQPAARDGEGPATADLPPVPRPPTRPAMSGAREEPARAPAATDLAPPEDERGVDEEGAIPEPSAETPLDGEPAGAQLSAADGFDAREGVTAPTPDAAEFEPAPPTGREKKSGRAFLWSLLGLLVLLAGGAAAVLTGTVPLPLGLAPSGAPVSPQEPVETALVPGADQPGPVRPVPAPAAQAETPGPTESPGAQPKEPRGEQKPPPEVEKKGAPTPGAEPVQEQREAQAPPSSAATPSAKAAGRVNPEAGDDSASTPLPGDRDWKSVLSRAEKLLRRGDEQEAEPLFRAVLEKEPDEHHAMEGLVKILLKRGAGTEALPMAERIVRKRSRRASYRLLYGDALSQSGDKAGAEEQWNQALRLSPGNVAALRRLQQPAAEKTAEPPAPPGGQAAEEKPAAENASE